MTKSSIALLVIVGAFTSACTANSEDASSSSDESALSTCASEGKIQGTNASSTGDPHMTSGDGLLFEDQLSGWHVEAKSDSAIVRGGWDLPLEVQISAAQYWCPAPYSTAHCTHAIDAYVAGNRVHFFKSGVVTVGGSPVALAPSTSMPLANRVTLAREADAPSPVYVITNGLGETFKMVIGTGMTIDLYVAFSPLRSNDRIGGILGCFDADTDPSNDLCARNKCQLSFPVSRVNAFIDEWQVLAGDAADTSE